MLCRNVLPSTKTYTGNLSVLPSGHTTYMPRPQVLKQNPKDTDGRRRKILYKKGKGVNKVEYVDKANIHDSRDRPQRIGGRG